MPRRDRSVSKEQVLALFEKSLGCGHCHLNDACPMADADVNDDCHQSPDRGGARYLTSAMLVFLLPLLTGIAGAFVAGRWSAASSPGSLDRWQMSGMFVGLLLGVLVARLLLSLIRQDEQTASKFARF